MTVSQPFDRKEIEDTLRSWLATSTGIEWIRAKQKKENPRPATPFGTYEIISIARIGGEDEEQTSNTPGSPINGEEITVSAIGLRRLTLSCNVYGRSDEPNQDPSAFCDRAISALSLSSFRNPLNDVNISVIDAGSTRDLDRIENEEWFKRAQFDAVFSVVSQITEKVGFVESIEVSGFLDTAQEEPFWTPNPQTFLLEETSEDVEPE